MITINSESDLQGLESGLIAIIDKEIEVNGKIIFSENVSLVFRGGKIVGNGLLCGNYTSVEAGLYPIFGKDITFTRNGTTGKWKCPYVHPEWFEMTNIGTNANPIYDDAERINKAVKFAWACGVVKLTGLYTIYTPVIVDEYIRLEGSCPQLTKITCCENGGKFEVELVINSGKASGTITVGEWPIVEPNKEDEYIDKWYLKEKCAILFTNSTGHNLGGAGASNFKVDLNNNMCNGIVAQVPYELSKFSGILVTGVSKNYSAFKFTVKYEDLDIENPVVYDNNYDIITDQDYAIYKAKRWNKFDAHVGQSLILEGCFAFLNGQYDSTLPLAPCYYFCQNYEMNLIGNKAFSYTHWTIPASDPNYKKGISFLLRDCEGVTIIGNSFNTAGVGIWIDNAYHRSYSSGFYISGNTNEELFRYQLVCFPRKEGKGISQVVLNSYRSKNSADGVFLKNCIYCNINLLAEGLLTSTSEPEGRPLLLISKTNSNTFKENVFYTNNSYIGEVVITHYDDPFDVNNDLSPYNKGVNLGNREGAANKITFINLDTTPYKCTWVDPITNPIPALVQSGLTDVKKLVQNSLEVYSTNFNTVLKKLTELKDVSLFEKEIDKLKRDFNELKLFNDIKIGLFNKCNEDPEKINLCLKSRLLLEENNINDLQNDD